MTADEFNTATDEIKQMEVVGDRVINAEKISFTARYFLEHRPKARNTHVTLMEGLYEHLADTASLVKTIQISILGRAAGD